VISLGGTAFDYVAAFARLRSANAMPLESRRYTYDGRGATVGWLLNGEHQQTAVLERTRKPLRLRCLILYQTHCLLAVFLSNVALSQGHDLVIVRVEHPTVLAAPVPKDLERRHCAHPFLVL
jgi:hypothetical protein